MGTVAELDAAGITGDGLRAAYAESRKLHEQHGRTYFLATRVLPAGRRPAIHALYGFARWVDDVVDDDAPSDALPDAPSNGPDGASDDRRREWSAQRRRAVVDAVEEDLAAAFTGKHASRPVVRALADTADRYAIPQQYFTAFLASMRSDLTVTDYADLGELRAYMYGSAAVIGLQVLPVLGTVAPRAEAAPHAAALGEAFQLTNFLRDVAEDLDRGRVYLPGDVLAAHGADRELLLHCRRTHRQDPRVRKALAELGEINRALYRDAEPGCPMLSPAARPCVETALRLYRGILDEIEEADYDVWTRRHRVPRARKARVAVPALGRALLARSVGS